MNRKNTHLTVARCDRKNRMEVEARAPYNFVPLPEKIVPARTPLPVLNRYLDGTFTGYIIVDIETRSPTYVRGMSHPGQHDPNQQNPDFYTSSDKTIEGLPEPAIPGSSLRGMLRSLVEVIAYGRMRWVTPKPTFTFRAVAASRDDPLAGPYREVIGAFAKNVRAGYLVKQGKEWNIRPAQRPQALDRSLRDEFLKVADRAINSGDVKGFRNFNHPQYQPAYYPVSFDYDVRRGNKGPYMAITDISNQKPLSQKGMLVCSGNMKESGQASGKFSPRKKHVLLLPPDEKSPLLPIDSRAIEDYLDGMSEYQQGMSRDNPDSLWKGERGKGFLKDGGPVFYVDPGVHGKVQYFGHSPNFRIPARPSGFSSSSNPLDFLPADHWTQSPDFADAIFGWVEEQASGKLFGPDGQRSGRVSIGDAHYTGHDPEQGLWYSPDPVVPHILGAPKPTTFQHYLIQEKPHEKQDLAHYGTDPEKTGLRGHKFYWVKGQKPSIQATLEEREHKTQTTRIRPVNPGTRFQFMIHFDNLYPEELGALGWALSFPGESGKAYCHRIGMGKPLGMGAIQVSLRLYISKRSGEEGRYQRLFNDQGSWYLSEESAEFQDYIGAFENYVLGKLGQPAGSLAAQERIQELLAMLEWRDDDINWAEQTRYMEIEHEIHGKRETLNEYKERPVLPTPLGVIAHHRGRSPSIFGSAPTQEPSRGVERLPEPVEIKVGNTISALMSFEDDGDVYLTLPGHPEAGEKGVLARIRQKAIRNQEFQKGKSIRCVIAEITQEGDETILECTLPGKMKSGEQRGVVLVYGQGGKPYGFIQPEGGGKDVFVHRNQLAGGLQSLLPGDRVIFELTKDKKGRLTANNVRREV